MVGVIEGKRKEGVEVCIYAVDSGEEGGGKKRMGKGRESDRKVGLWKDG